MGRDELGRFVKGHKGFKPWKDKKFSKKHIENLSESHKGQPGYWTGKKRGMIPKSAFKKGQSPWNKGLPRNEKTKKKISKSKKGQIPWNKWKKVLATTGKKNPSWKGGKSFEPYGIEFNNQLKEEIRKRDNYRCQQCFRHQTELFRNTVAGIRSVKLDIHHIDFNKKNNKPNNLISLCGTCHIQTNFNREQWTDYFQNKIEGVG
jgi:hypothetical protein